ncbi:MAG: imidazoleglycerol-phosphate dehydratase [Rhodobacterales bacterium 12-65-15]|nr:MAG: imidazoleglycerol-phosphate dehydratase [Rhodobacterales bacterium 12-65-15]
MKAFALTAALLLVGTTALADPVEGVWQTVKDDNGNYGHVEIKPCGPAFCGTLIAAFDGTGAQIDSPNVGRAIVSDMVAYPDGLYDDGTIYSPDRDKTYNGDMTLSGDSLAVRGCVFGICRDGGTWSRVK